MTILSDEMIHPSKAARMERHNSHCDGVFQSKPVFQDGEQMNRFLSATATEFPEWNSAPDPLFPTVLHHPEWPCDAGHFVNHTNPLRLSKENNNL